MVDIRTQKYWWSKEGDELANSVATLIDTLRLNDGYRRAVYSACLTLYEGRPITINDDGEVTDELTGDDLTDLSFGGNPIFNLTRSACDAVRAEIAARQKPKPMFTTKGGDWQARRRAKKLDKFVEGQLSQAQGMYPSTWDLTQICFHDSSKLGVGIAKVTANVISKRVDVERCFPWEVLVDPKEARKGKPASLFHTYSMDIPLVVDQFIELDDDDEPVDEENQAKYFAIHTANRPTTTEGRTVEMIRIYEAWHLPMGEDRPGKHVICTNTTVLFEEEWTSSDFPFVFYWWERHSTGFWATGIAQAHGALHLEIEDTAKRIQNAIAICSTKRTFYDSNATKLEDLEEGGMPEILIATEDLAKVPVEREVTPISAQVVQWLWSLVDKYYAFSGVSQMSASAQKEPGVTAGIAMQTLNDIYTVRFLPKARGYEDSFVTMGKLMVECADRVAEHNGGYLVRWPGKNFVREINWNDVQLSEELYEIRVAPISMYSRDPAAQLQIAQDLLDQGIINRETFLQMTQLPDLEALMSKESAEREYLEDVLDRLLDAGDDDELDELGGYEPPSPFLLNKQGAMWLAVSTYFDAKKNDAPLFNLGLLEEWIEQLENVLQAKNAPPAPPPGPEALPPGAVPPGAAPPDAAGLPPVPPEALM